MATQCIMFMLLTLIPLLTLSQSFLTFADETGKALVTSTCNKTEYPEECVSALESDPRSFISNLTELTRISLEITSLRAQNSFTVATYWVSHASDYEGWSFASTCSENYNFSIYHVKDSLQAFDESKYDKAYQSIDSVNSIIQTCQNFGYDPLTDVNAKMLRIAKDVMSILHMLF